MTPDSEVLKSFFTAKAAGYPPASAPHEVATLLALGELTAEHRAAIISKYGLEGDPRLHAIFLDWVIELVQKLLGSGSLFLRIRSGAAARQSKPWDQRG